MSTNASTRRRRFVRDSARRRLLTCGAPALSEIEILTLLLKGTDKLSAHDLAVQLLAECGSLRSLLTSDFSTLSRHGLSVANYITLHAALELNRRHYQQLLMTGPALKHPRIMHKYLQMRLRDVPHEVFGVFYLNTHHRVLEFEELFRGTIDGAIVHPREVVKAALKHNAAAVIFVHNHPSGIAEPTAPDRQITLRLREALSLVDIRVVDHLVVGDGVCESFAERGLL